MKEGCIFGTHRVIEPEGVMPQAAWRIDNTMEIYDNEILINVKTLNLDSASFHQIREEAGGDTEIIKEIIMKTIETRGKQHNPVTGSGGMLIGQVHAVGDKLKDRPDISPGDRIATLVSLSLTPLKVEKITAVNIETAQVDVVGQAILFESGIFARLPQDMPEKVALAALDVAGAPAQVSRLVKKGDTVAVLGPGGKSGLLCLYEARKQAGPDGMIIAVGRSETACRRAHATGLADVVLSADANNAMEVYCLVHEATQGKLADVTINCTNVPRTEMASILSTRDGGKTYFFNMATSFTAAALGAEGVGKDVELIIGNGYTRGHADHTLNILREDEKLRSIFTGLSDNS
ncbi:MAG: L-erythro-3,5-diaminohexanoate dehydrogenase [Bacillota bacterium]|nr:L-erythro-3,5-diaminohexanoate dehydrogenase [Bacillota bacterium]MDW7684517.1 L-erythro-3,5-diaminohexanoate dehydrogenase [Bacillota bacterium]